MNRVLCQLHFKKNEGKERKKRTTHTHQPHTHTVTQSQMMPLGKEMAQCLTGAEDTYSMVTKSGHAS